MPPCLAWLPFVWKGFFLSPLFSCYLLCIYVFGQARPPFQTPDWLNQGKEEAWSSSNKRTISTLQAAPIAALWEWEHSAIGVSFTSTGCGLAEALGYGLVAAAWVATFFAESLRREEQPPSSGTLV